jgi:DNA-binding CsgD family transcriptional regulator
MLKKIFYIFLFFPFFTFSQSVDTLQNSRAKIEMEEKVKALLNRHIRLNNQKGLMGWRLQIFSDTDREKAQKKRKQFLLDFPEIAAYLSHKEPYFKVTIGNFYTKLEAKKVKQEISKKYNCYIVPSKIVIEN